MEILRGRARDRSPVDDGPGEHRLLDARQLLPDRRPDAIRSDDTVDAHSLSACEDDFHLVAQLLDPHDPAA